MTDDTNPAKYLKKAYQLTTSGGGGQWCGWQFNSSPSGDKWLRMSAWVKFIDSVPPASGNYGFKIQGNVNNGWVSEMVPNEWKWVSQVSQVVPGGDGNHDIYIFDSVGQYT